MRFAPDDDTVLAFAAVFQAATLTHQLAAADDYDAFALHHLALSVLRVDAESAAAVFGPVQALRLGLECATRIVGGHPDAATREVFQYAAGMHQLSVKLARNRRAQATLSARLAELRDRHGEHADHRAHDDALHEDLGVLYTRTLSRLRPRIIVRGAEGRLTDAVVVSRVRTALLAGARAAWLWRQLGGRRWQVVALRNDYHRRASRLLKRAFS